MGDSKTFGIPEAKEFSSRETETHYWDLISQIIRKR